MIRDMNVLAWMGALAVFGGSVTASAELTLNVVEKAPPAAFDSSIREVLQSQAVQLVDGDKPVYEFWFRKSVPLKSKPAEPSAGLKSVAETTLLAAAVVKKSQRDYRDDELYADTYTLRFSLQPQDGNHLGTAEFPYFVALVPVQLDTSLNSIETYKQLVKASQQETSTAHPIVMSLQPVQEIKGDYPRLNDPAPDHKSLLVKLPAQAEGDDVDLVFNLVYEGVAVH